MYEINLLWMPFFLVCIMQPLGSFCGNLQHMACHPTQELTCLRSMRCWNQGIACPVQMAVHKKCMTWWWNVSRYFLTPFGLKYIIIYKFVNNYNAVKCNLTTNSVCVPLSVCRIVMHMCQCIHLCMHSPMPSGVLWHTCTSASNRGLHSLLFCCVCLFTCASAWFALVLVSLCSQCSSLIPHAFDVVPFCLQG